MPTTIARPLTNGAGVALLNGAGTSLYEAGIGAGELLNGGWIWTQIANSLGVSPVQLSEAVLAMLAGIPFVGDIINQVTAQGTLDLIYAMSPKVDTIDTNVSVLKTDIDYAGNTPPTLRDDIQTILSAIDALDGVVNLPSTPPAGYGGGATAEDIWGYYIEAGPPAVTARWLLDAAGTWADTVGFKTREKLQYDPNFEIAPFNPDDSAGFDIGAYFENADWPNVTNYATVLDALSAWYPTYTWQGPNPAGEYYVDNYHQPASNSWRVYCSYTDAKLAEAKTASQAPLWPGDAGVTKGTPTVLTASGVVAGPMDGVLVTVDSVSPGTGRWAVGDFSDWMRAGYVMFLSPEGHADVIQYIGPEQAVYVPKAMVQAGSVLVFFGRAEAVTVTPWLKA